MLSFAQQSLQLPSKMIPYSVQNISMESIGMEQLMLMSRAVATGSWTPVVQAMESLIDLPPDQRLTDGDFYYLLSLQRLIAYQISPLQARWECQGQMYMDNEGNSYTGKQLQDRVAEYDNATDEQKEEMVDPSTLMVHAVPCTATNAVNVTLDSLEVVTLTDTKLDDRLDYPRVDTLVDAHVMSDTPDNAQIVQAARWLKEGNTLEEKLDVLRASPTLELFELCLQTDKKVRHGVSQLIHTSCNTCGQLSEHLFNVGPETFFDV